MLPRIIFIALCGFAIYSLFRFDPWPMPENIQGFDKWAHFALFLALSCSSYFVFVSMSPVFYQLPLLAFAVSSEWIQAVFLPRRSFSMGDLEADLTGVVLGSLFCMICRRGNWRFKWK